MDYCKKLKGQAQSKRQTDDLLKTVKREIEMLRTEHAQLLLTVRAQYSSCCLLNGWNVLYVILNDTRASR